MQLQSFDFDEYLEEILSKSAKICQDKLEAEKAIATEFFFKETYNNLLKMECSPFINDKVTEEQQKVIEKFLEESYYNILRMFDGVSETGKS